MSTSAALDVALSLVSQRGGGSLLTRSSTPRFQKISISPSFLMKNTPPTLWQPTASLAALQARARLNRAIRDFFAAHEVMEVETPLLCAATATDPHLASFSVDVQQQRYFLQTSPEFCMKRLLAAGAGAIYQLGKAFRADEVGRCHNPEFTLLEWYRPGFDLTQLIDETESLVRAMAGLFGRAEGLVTRRVSYRQVFLATVGLDPLLASEEQLAAAARARVPGLPEEWDRDGWLNVLMSAVVEPALPEGMTFVFGFPPSQASLAVCEPDADGVMVARRVELYLGGMELANGYQELTDAEEQRRRCTADIAAREAMGGMPVPLPVALVDALASGMPSCAGIALGVDRLLMWLAGAEALSEVCAFPADRA